MMAQRSRHVIVTTGHVLGDIGNLPVSRPVLMVDCNDSEL